MPNSVYSVGVSGSDCGVQRNCDSACVAKIANITEETLTLMLGKLDAVSDGFMHVENHIWESNQKVLNEAKSYAVVIANKTTEQ